MTRRGAVLIGAMALAGCSAAGNGGSTTGSGVSSTATDGATTTVASVTTVAEREGTEVLRPADEARADNAFDRMVFHELGEEVEVGDVTVTITGFAVEPDDQSGLLAVTARVANSSEGESSVPELAVMCTGNPEEGGWMADSTLSLYDTLPAKSFDEGTVILNVPGDGRYGERVPECVGPAVIVAKPMMTLTKSDVAAWTIPDDIRVALNDAAAAGVGLIPASELATTDTIVVSAKPTIALVAAENAETGADLTTPGQAVAALADADIECPLSASPDDGNSIELGAEFTGDEYACIVGDQKITITFYADASTRSASFTGLMTMFGPMLKQFGVESFAVAYHDDGNWIASVEPSDDSTSTKPRDVDLAMLDRVADALDGTVHTTEL